MDKTKPIVFCELCPRERRSFAVMFDKYGLKKMADHMKENHDIVNSKDMPVKLVTPDE